MSKIPYFQFKNGENTFNNYFRVKITSNYIKHDINGFYGPEKEEKNTSW